MPFLSCSHPLRTLSLVAEVDGTHYDRDPHPKGRKYKTKVNAGLKYRLLDHIDLSLSYVRGNNIAGSISAFYNFGNTTGFVPKIKDTLPYRAPINIERVGPASPRKYHGARFLLRHAGARV